MAAVAPFVFIIGTHNSGGAPVNTFFKMGQKDFSFCPGRTFDVYAEP